MKQNMNTINIVIEYCVLLNQLEFYRSIIKLIIVLDLNV